MYVLSEQHVVVEPPPPKTPSPVTKSVSLKSIVERPRRSRRTSVYAAPDPEVAQRSSVPAVPGVKPHLPRTCSTRTVSGAMRKRSTVNLANKLRVRRQSVMMKPFDGTSTAGSFRSSKLLRQDSSESRSLTKSSSRDSLSARYVETKAWLTSLGNVRVQLGELTT